MNGTGKVLCPSAQPTDEDAVAFGIVTPEASPARIKWLEQPIPASPDLLAKTGDVSPTRVLRFAGACQETSCQHFDGADCRLATRLVEMLDPVADKPPPCMIRPDCRWFSQEGVAACRRCPQIVTETSNPDERMRQAAGAAEQV